MQILIGNSPSTGSSLLRQMLNRHPEIFCGPESYLFIYPQLFTKWEKFKSGIVGGRHSSNRLKSRSFFLQKDVILQDREYGSRSEEELEALVESSSGIEEFTHQFYQPILEARGKKMWAEKSPANTINFFRFIKAFPQGRVVHVVRDPYDTITSLLYRGTTLYDACAVYLIQTAQALRARENARYHEIRYEALVRDPEEVLSGFLESMQLKFDKVMLSEGNPEMSVEPSMTGWKYEETGKVEKGSVGRFAELDKETQKTIRGAMGLIRISPGYALKEDLLHLGFPAICGALGYPFIDPPKKVKGELKQDLKRQQKMYFARCIRGRFWRQLREPGVEIHQYQP